MVSSDGSRWSDSCAALNLNASYLWDVIYADNRFIAVGNDNTQATGYHEETPILTSTDGLAWTMVNHSGLPGGKFWVHIAYGRTLPLWTELEPIGSGPAGGLLFRVTDFGAVQ